MSTKVIARNKVIAWDALQVLRDRYFPKGLLPDWVYAICIDDVDGILPTDRARISVVGAVLAAGPEVVAAMDLTAALDRRSAREWAFDMFPPSDVDSARRYSWED